MRVKAIQGVKVGKTWHFPSDSDPEFEWPRDAGDPAPYVAAGVLELVEESEPENEFPQGFPSRDALIAANILTFAAVREHPDLTKVSGIGTKKAEAILAALPAVVPPETKPEGGAETEGDGDAAVTTLEGAGDGNAGDTSEGGDSTEEGAQLASSEEETIA